MEGGLEGTVSALAAPIPRRLLASHATSSPVRIASPSPARISQNSKPLDFQDEKLDFEKVRRRAARKKNKRQNPPVAQAVHTIKGFQTPGTSCGEESDVSRVGTPVLSPMRKNLASVSSSPAMRPLTPQSGISALKLQIDALSLSGRPFAAKPAMLQRSNTESGTSEASDSERMEMDSYEVQLDVDFVNSDMRAHLQLCRQGNGTPGRSLVRKMTADNFESITCLGKGTYGTVVLVRQKETGRLFAQKQFKKASLVVHKKLVEQTKTERVILESVNRHPFVVKLYYAFQDDEKLYLILEYAQGGELFHHLSLERMFSEETAAFYLAEMVLALDHLHNTVGVVYRDLKPENCLLDAEGHLLLTDFGLSKVPVDTADKCRSFLGTVEYMAPEIISGHEYGMAVDWWSLGALAHDLLTGSPPFMGPNNAKIQHKILHSKLQLPYFLGPDAKDFLTRLLRKDPNKRLGANMPKDLQTIKSHRFFRKIDWKKLARREVEPPIRPVITDPALAENFSAEFTGRTMSPTLIRTLDDLVDETQDGELFGGFSFVGSSSLLESGNWYGGQLAD
jgi:serine/threonine protein kinase